ncbi:MAG: hypothetical protein JW791_03415 [Nanoarchaeota archaeon]|nr:hypothetical protein [Nanoarchaeota archaeon]
MKCSKCGNNMVSMGLVALQDDYSAKEELCFDLIERFKCDVCEETFEVLKRLNKE